MVQKVVGFCSDQKKTASVCRGDVQISMIGLGENLALPGLYKVENEESGFFSSYGWQIGSYDSWQRCP